MLRGVNLIKADRRQARQCGIRLRRWGLSCAIYMVGVLVLVGTVMTWGAGSEGVETLEHRVARVDRKIERTHDVIDAFKPRVREAAAALAVGRTLRSQPDWSMMFGLFSQLLGPKAVLTGCQLESMARPQVVAAEKVGKTPSGRETDVVTASATAKRSAMPDVTKRDYRVNLIGLGQSQSEVLGYVRRLERSGLFTTVRLLDTRQHVASGRSAVAFHIECLLSGRS